jgi:type I restriction enzyme M protein
VLKRCKKPDDVLFINASGPENFRKGKRLNYMTDEHIDRIIRTYQERPEEPIERYARRVDMNEIASNDYSLNVSRYVSTAQDEVEVDLTATHAKLVGIQGVIRTASAKHNEFLKELGLPPLPSVDSN